MPRPVRALAISASLTLLALVGATGCSSGQLLAVGARPPASLSAVDQNGQVRSIGAQKGQPLVVYFDP